MFHIKWLYYKHSTKPILKGLKNYKTWSYNRVVRVGRYGINEPKFWLRNNWTIPYLNVDFAHPILEPHFMNRAHNNYRLSTSVAIKQYNSQPKKPVLTSFEAWNTTLSFIYNKNPRWRHHLILMIKRIKFAIFAGWKIDSAT